MSDLKAQGCALVHPSTQRGTPAEQATGTYVYRPFEVQAWERGEPLSSADAAVVREFFGMAADAPLADQRKQIDPALFAAPYRETQVQAAPKVARRRGGAPVGGVGAVLFNLVDQSLPLLTEQQQEHFFKQLAEKLGYDIQ